MASPWISLKKNPCCFKQMPLTIIIKHERSLVQAPSKFWLEDHSVHWRVSGFSLHFIHSISYTCFWHKLVTDIRFEVTLCFMCFVIYI